MVPTLGHYLAVSAALFAFGAFTLMTHRRVLGLVLGLELVLHAAALDFVAFDHFGGDGKGTGQAFAAILVALGAAQAAIALAVALSVHRSRGTLETSELTDLRN
jgi:NADH-quinone oxidoreductase subunit K